MKPDIEIAKGVRPKPIEEIASKLGVSREQFEPYGFFKAKLPLSLIREDGLSNKKLILVSAITPTPAGEGKTTISIGLCEGLNLIGKPTAVVLREPSLGPVFGQKGGATGGGYSQVVPMEDINLHFTGDFAAVEKAHNLLAAIIDNNIHSMSNNPGLDPRSVRWKRVMDVNDRALRQVITGLGGITSGVPRQTGFDITAASEVMAILCLASSLDDLKQRLGNILVGFTRDGRAVFARDLKAQGAMATLLKDAIKPNLVQTLEGNPAIIHGGPFANIAQGTNSVLATKMALSLRDHVVTEAGFGFDLGAEKFLNIKSVLAGIQPKVVVIVATVRALRYHGGVSKAGFDQPNPVAVRKGLENLEKHLENARLFNICPVVAINRFSTDTAEEIQIIKGRCEELGVKAAETTAHAKGGAGAVELATLVAREAERDQPGFKPLYDWEWSVEKKIETVATSIYGASEINYMDQAKADLERIEKLGLSRLPVCIAKTQKSFSDNPSLRGRPLNFSITVREIEIASGAGFLIPITGNITRMPGLPVNPVSEIIDIDNNGNITGLF